MTPEELFKKHLELHQKAVQKAKEVHEADVELFEFQEKYKDELSNLQRE